MFRKVLIANRGEIAVRIAATLQQMGIRVIAVYSEPDQQSVHVGCADEAYPLTGRTAAETYLCQEQILAIAKEHEVGAIHPGYGFLSENSVFAQACHDAGITFIGPSAQVIRAMGDKIQAKAAFAKAGVPVVPGWSGEIGGNDGAVMREAKRIGFPVLVKAAAGGGGRGMRVVHDEGELAPALESAQREAAAAFGDSRVFLEKYITHPRHVEFQIFGDRHGNVVHLFERECSIQRRHQKIVEESPSPALSPELRKQMGEAAVAAAKAVGYTNAGTVEFLVAPSGEFFFLEVNTRLQVEHPVTELVVGQDLVRAQVTVAVGEPLSFVQDDLHQVGCALECRIYAEDPARGFAPSTGVIDRYQPPGGPGIRVDSGVAEGSTVSVHYDPMLAKLIVHARTRSEAIDRMSWALNRFAILGVTTNVAFLDRLVTHPEFRAGRLHTDFLQVQRLDDVCDPFSLDLALAVAALAVGHDKARHRHGRSASVEPASSPSGPWHGAGAWRAF